ncbi:MAG TPA: tyrosine-type recombinase/integrase [Syntrophorhabdaceae bacterium]|nr:tyrosine-type recombinase/integrase [Syntrophorhabdaceae bacterium]
MKGSIQKKGSIYYAVIPIGGKRKWYKGGDTKKDAQRILTEKLFEIDAGTYKEIPKTTFKEFAEFWLNSYVEGNLKPSTAKGYRDIVKKNLSHFDGRVLSEITTGQLQAYVTRRLRLVSAKTVCNDTMVMKLLFRHARKWGYLKLNPAEDVDRPKLKGTEVEILEPHELKQLLEKTDQRYQTAFLTAFLTGLRAGELWALKWSDIDWSSGKLFVRRSVWKGGFQTPKTRKSVRKVDMPQQLIQALKRWKLASPVGELDLVFPGIKGGTANHVNVMNRQFYPALRRAGLRQVSFHSLRHSNASMRIQGGQNIKYISEQLGHSTIRITLDIYGHLFNDVNFTKQQVELLESSFESVRNPLENTPKSQVNDLTPRIQLIENIEGNIGGGIRI